jgi:hypothetical protein
MNWKLPRYAAAVLDALHLSRPAPNLASLREPEWKSTLNFCDRTQLTLSLGQRWGPLLPLMTRQRIERNYADNSLRIERIKQAYGELSAALERVQAEYVVLKGFTQFPRFSSDLNARVQYDLDLFCPRESLGRAAEAAGALGYEPVSGDRGITDHLPRMARKTGWQWRDNYFDPDIPIAIELHFRLWDTDTEGFGTEGLHEFWERRTTCPVDDRPVPVLAPADALGYSALHLLRHVLRGSAQPYHVYELAYFLDRSAADVAFWKIWREWHPARLRRLEAISFRLAADWFGGELPAAARAEIDDLPAAVKAWFARYAASPVEQLFRPNKDELWLHLCLLSNWRAATSILRRRLLPSRLPAHVDAIYIPDARMTPRLRVRKWYRYAKFVGSRLAFHWRAHLRTAGRGVLWLWILWVRGGTYRRRQHPEIEREHTPVSEQVAR